MGSNEAKDWGIWWTATTYTVSHFLKTCGPESEVRRFATKQAAEVFIAGRWVGNRYTPRLIPNPKPLPVKG